MRTPTAPATSVVPAATFPAPSPAPRPRHAVKATAAWLPDRVATALWRFVTAKAVALRDVDDELAPVADLAAEFVAAGGKGLRPAFCYWGWRGAGGADSDEAVTAAAALELLHTCALVHDDVMDDSPTRRGRPAVHRRLAALHRGSGWRGDADRFGQSAAVLLGDAFLAWADEMLVGSGLPPSSLARAWPVYADMRTELVAGQYLDLVGQASGRVDAAAAAKIARYKTAGYTVQRPLQLGGALAGAPPALLDAYRTLGLPVGEAFQLRDDVLGAFGDPTETGKPSGDDLRDGKRTALVAATLTRCTQLQACRVEALLRRRGHPGEHPGEHPAGSTDRDTDDSAVDELRSIVVEVGALDAVEAVIAARTEAALAVLRRVPVDPEVRDALSVLVTSATARRL